MIDFKALAEHAFEVPFGDETVPVGLPSPEVKAQIMAYAGSRDSMSDVEKGAYGTNVAAKCLAATVATDQEMTEADWARVVVRSDADPIEGLTELIATAMRACGFTATVRQDDATNRIAETDEAIGDLPTT